jgi:hypothetical protein
MADPFDSVLGTHRGNGAPSEEEQTPMRLARALAADINDGVLGKGPELVPRLIQEAPNSGLALGEVLDVGPPYDFYGHALSVSLGAEDPPFAVLYLAYKRGSDAKFAQLWLLDRGE